MKKVLIIGIGEGYEYQLEWVYHALPTEELKEMFLDGNVDLYDIRSYPEKGDAIDAIIRDYEDIAAVVAVHLYWYKDESSYKKDVCYNVKNEYLPIITKEFNIPLIVIGDQPDHSFKTLDNPGIYNM